MPTWTIISPCEDDYDHPMRMNIFRVMKTVYRMLDSPNEPSTVGEGKHIATLGYAGSQEKPGPPDLSSLVIHFRLSTQTVTHFVVVFCDQQIEDRVQNVCISVPCELTPIMTDIYEFVAARSISSRGLNPAEECDLAHRIWKQLQVEKYHKRLLQQGVVSDIDIAFSRPGSPRCPICDSNLIHCNSCQVASCESNECRGSSEPPLARCSRHQKEALCFPCLEEQESQPEIEKCPGCKSWCCTMDMSLCSGHPINVLPILRIPGSESIPPGLIVAYTQSARAHPPKRGSCMECELPGWRSCNSNLCWSHTICPECASSGMTCLCQEVWACDLCAEYNPGVFIRCPRCNRPFCCACSYIEECQQCHRTNLCYDCAEEESGGNDEADGGIS
ncbi:uncharacterized protein EDB91DRAFT_169583 [Suillus paluster]|uniref:uncharacterized protein n=1 Tax=Suillus paluster TaxID=48578 RepID=UPI001B86310F|nr:uncharacterized protein EDB91DRAFT_169583 [Suillus paluster]KAG1744963.1 hypothetical protein EDB91DRAFT_169583 [Suillus paluster]